MKFQVTRSGRAAQAIQEFRSRLAPRLESGIMAAGEKILDLSQPLVPVDTGSLKASGTVRQEGAGWTTEAIVGYGRADFRLFTYSPSEGKWVTRVPFVYAVRQHEDNLTHTNGEAEFLRKPTLENQVEIAAAFRAGAGL